MSTTQPHRAYPNNVPNTRKTTPVRVLFLVTIIINGAGTGTLTLGLILGKDAL